MSFVISKVMYIISLSIDLISLNIDLNNKGPSDQRLLHPITPPNKEQDNVNFFAKINTSFFFFKCYTIYFIKNTNYFLCKVSDTIGQGSKGCKILVCFKKQIREKNTKSVLFRPFFQTCIQLILFNMWCGSVVE